MQGTASQAGPESQASSSSSSASARPSSSGSLPSARSVREHVASPATVSTGMSSAQAQRVIVVCALVEAGLVAAALKTGGIVGGSTFKRLFAVAALATGLAVVAEVAPQVAGPFALLVLVAMGVRYRGAFGGVVNRTRAPQPAAASGGGKR